MIKNKNDVQINTRLDEAGEINLKISDLSDFWQKNPNLKMFAHVTLPVGKSIDFHIHKGESETYYILSGKGLYNDNGESKIVTPGCVTLTPSGAGHSLKNIGDSDLEFIVLIILD